MFQQVGNRTLQYFCGLPKKSNSKIAVIAKQFSDFSGLMIVVYTEIFSFFSWQFSADSTSIALPLCYLLIHLLVYSMLSKQNVFAAAALPFVALKVTIMPMLGYLFSAWCMVILFLRGYRTGFTRAAKTIIGHSIFMEFRQGFGSFTSVATFHYQVRCLIWPNFHMIKSEGITD